MRYRIDSMSLRGGELIIDGWAFGDSENDIELLQAAGTGVAVGNAMEETKQAADYVTEMKMIRHPYENGIQARAGIEY